MDALITFLVLLVMFGLLVSIHEFGHFAAAKLCGIHVNEFAIGFGPALISKHWHGTSYVFRVLPFGGYVSLAGEYDRDDENSFHRQPFRIRFLVLIAGIVMNLFLALIIFAIYLAASGYQTNMVRITDYNFIGTNQVEQYYPLIISEILPDSGAAAAGLSTQDFIVGVEGNMFTADSDLPALLSPFVGEEVEFNIIDNEGNISMVPVTVSDEGKVGIAYQQSLYGIYDLQYPSSVLSAIPHTINITGYQIAAISELISISIEENDIQYAAQGVNGVAGVSKVVGDLVQERQFLSVLSMTGLISLSLAIMNLLPIPALDGGQIAIAATERLTRRTLSQRTMEILNLGSFVFVILLTILITYKDIIQFDMLAGLRNIWQGFIGR